MKSYTAVLIFEFEFYLQSLGIQDSGRDTGGGRVLEDVGQGL